MRKNELELLLEHIIEIAKTKETTDEVVEELKKILENESSKEFFERIKEE